MRKFKVFTVVAVMALISSGMFNACQKENVTQNKNETTLIKQLKSTDFVIIAENEMQFLGNPEPIDEFRVNVSNYIDVAVDMMDCYFVFYIDNGIVKNGQVGKNPTSSILNSWCNRLRGYVEIARNYPIIDEFDEIPLLDGVCQTFSKRKYAKDMVNSLVGRDDVKSVCMTKNEDGTYTVCWEYEK